MGKQFGKTAHSSFVMVCGGITSDGKTPFVSVDAGVKKIKDVYLKPILGDVLKPWSTYFESKQ